MSSWFLLHKNTNSQHFPDALVINDRDPNRARQTHCRLSAYLWKLIISGYLCRPLINVDQTLPERESFLTSVSLYSCPAAILSCRRPLKQQDQILGSSCFTALRASLLSEPVIQSSHHSMTDGMRGMHSQLLHSLISHSTTERNRLTMKVRLIFHSYLLHKLMVPFHVECFPCFHPDSAAESLTHPPSFFRLYKLQLGHVFYFGGPCWTVLERHMMSHTRQVLSSGS